MNDVNHVSEQLRELAKSLRERPAPEVEHHLLREFRAHHSRRRRRWIYLMQAAALLLLAFALSFLFLVRSRHITPSRAQNNAQEFDRAAFSDFVPLPYAQSGVPLGEAVVMRVQLRASDLTALGAPVPVSDTRQSIVADVLIGQDGVPRAIHFVQ